MESIEGPLKVLGFQVGFSQVGIYGSHHGLVAQFSTDFQGLLLIVQGLAKQSHRQRCFTEICERYRYLILIPDPLCYCVSLRQILICSVVIGIFFIQGTNVVHD